MMKRFFVILLGCVVQMATQGIAAPATQPAPPPDGFDQRKADTTRGKLEVFEYDAKAAHGHYRATVYLPHDYLKQSKYPVLYLLHGASGDERTWVDDCHADVILDNLLAAKSAVPMIVVMPAGIAVDSPAAKSKDRRERMQASRTFDRVLLTDLIPAIDAKYSTQTDANHRALAGLSAGAGQAFLIGLTHSDTFASVAAFSLGGVGLRAVAQMDKSDAANKQFKMIWISCGRDDGFFADSKATADALTKKNIRHIWYPDEGGHEPKVWKNGLYLIVMALFNW